MFSFSGISVFSRATNLQLSLLPSVQDAFVFPLGRTGAEQGIFSPHISTLLTERAPRHSCGTACLEDCAGGERAFPSSTCNLHSKEELQALQFSLLLEHQIFPGLSSLSLFQPPSISGYHGEWNASSIQVVGWIGFEVDVWWESLIPPSLNTAPAWFLTFHLPETGSQREGAEKEAGSVLLRCSFSSEGEISSREKVLRTSVQSLVLKLAEAWMLTWVHAPASPRHPGKERFMYKPCSCLGLGFEGWCNRCNVKGKVRNEWTWCMLWHKLLLSCILLLAFILVPCHTRSGISLLQSNLPGFLAVMLKLAGESVFSGILTVPVCTGCLRAVLLAQCQNRLLNKVPSNNKFVELWILIGPGLKWHVGDTAEVHEMELQIRKIKMIALENYTENTSLLWFITFHAR